MPSLRICANQTPVITGEHANMAMVGLGVCVPRDSRDLIVG